MIFNNEEVTELIVLWQIHNDEETFNEIINLSTPLIEAIVSGFNWEHRDDLIQESTIKLYTALETYDTTVGSAYSYMCAVIRNCCNGYMRDAARHNKICQDMPVAHYDVAATEEFILADLITRNRCRFPSLNVDTIDAATQLLYQSISENSTKPRGIVLRLMQEVGLPRPIATVLYHSSLAWLRNKYLRFAVQEVTDVDESTLLPDVLEFLGEPVYKRLATLFSGMYLKMP